MKQTTNGAKTLLLSFLELRRAVGYVGLGLPFAVSLGGWAVFGNGLQDSISSYYYTGMRDVLVGALCAIGIFMLSYKGYEPKDSIAGNLAGLFAFGVALFPTTPTPSASTCQEIIGHVHLAFASLFFSTLAYFSLRLFTKTDQAVPSNKKLQRNKVYRTCGYAMVACLILILAAKISHASDTGGALGKWDLIFWLESIAIAAFGVSWMTKGEAILKDLEPEQPGTQSI